MDILELEKQNQKLIEGNLSISTVTAFDKRILENIIIKQFDISKFCNLQIFSNYTIFA